MKTARYKGSPDQPRVPAGTEEGGEWAPSEGAQHAVEKAKERAAGPDDFEEYQPGSGQGTLYETRNGAGVASPEVRKAAKELRKKNAVALHNTPDLEDHEALKEVREVMGDAVADFTQLASEIVRANTPFGKDVSIGHQKDSDYVSVDVTEVGPRRQGIEPRLVFEVKGDGVYVTGPRGHKTIPADASLEEVADVLHRINGYKKPDKSGKKSLPAPAVRMASLYARALGEGNEGVAFSVGKAFAAAYPELELLTKFSPDQPREPAGTEEGGEFAPSEGAREAVEKAKERAAGKPEAAKPGGVEEALAARVGGLDQYGWDQAAKLTPRQVANVAKQAGVHPSQVQAAINEHAGTPEKPKKSQQSGKHSYKVSNAGMSEHAEGAVHEALAEVPEPVHKLFAEFGGSVKVGKLVTEVNPELKGTSPRGWPPGATWDRAEGLYDPDKRAAVVTEFSEDEGGNKTRVDPKRLRGVALHEYGHGVDRALGANFGRYPERLFSQSTEFREAHAADVASGLPPGYKYYTQEGDAGPEEAFAECFADLHGESTCYRTPGTMAKHFPRTSALIKKRLESL